MHWTSTSMIFGTEKSDLLKDLNNSPLIREKVHKDQYAQNLYAALCNMEWQRTEVLPILKDETWNCSWRTAGGIVANLRAQGDYLDWYCSGMGEGLGNGDPDGVLGYVAESVVTDEIREDLATLGWHPVLWKEEE
jgi:hypothetical protein